ncbi:methyltransferase domain-containing protein [Roseibium sp.]|uniref:methyltransferase domain-containing protein n=1 Tax=Roseibium sp. TaxID=1936156 RepID=UPI003A97FCCD
MRSEQDMTDIDEDALAEAYKKGLELEKSGDLDGAEAEYRKALALDPSDPGGVSIRLAAMGREAAPERMPEAYVATLFDQHADVFDDILVDQLGYCVPILLREKVRELGLGPFDRLLDLGCGTGLTGISFSDCTNHMTGVDLSEQIVEVAYDREVYEDLYVGEAVSFLEEFEEEDGSTPLWDFIAATDVFPYLGAIEPMVTAAAARLEPRGFFAFSTETLPEDVLSGRDYMVGRKQRFAQSESYLRRVLGAEGFAILSLDPITVRLEDGEPVPGHMIIARKLS